MKYKKLPYPKLYRSFDGDIIKLDKYHQIVHLASIFTDLDIEYLNARKLLNSDEVHVEMTDHFNEQHKGVRSELSNYYQQNQLFSLENSWIALLMLDEKTIKTDNWNPFINALNDVISAFKGNIIIAAQRRLTEFRVDIDNMWLKHLKELPEEY